jgi:hypothetical protein
MSKKRIVYITVYEQSNDLFCGRTYNKPIILPDDIEEKLSEEVKDGEKLCMTHGTLMNIILGE